MCSSRGVMLLIALAVLTVSWGERSFAETVHVCPSGCEFDSIAEAVSFAREGDVIDIAPGKYDLSRTVVIEKAIALQGGGFWQTSITWSGAPDEPLFHLTGPGASGSSFRSLNFVGIAGRAIKNDGASFEVDLCWFIDCAVDLGYFPTSSEGGAAICSLGGVPVITSCVFLQCEAISGYGGAVFCNGVRSGSRIEDSYFLSNTSKGLAGALCIFYGEALVRNCVFDGNQSFNDPTGFYRGNGGAMALMYSADVTVQDCEISNNSSESSGGGVYLGSYEYLGPDSSVYLLLNRFESNHSTTAGGAVASTVDPMNKNTLLAGNVFQSNRSGSGGGVSIWGSPLLWGNSFQSNYARLQGGGLQIANREEGIYDSPPPDAVVIQCDFTGNVALKGGAINTGHNYYPGSSQPLGRHVRIDSCAFESNVALSTGGVSMSHPNTTVLFGSCSFDGNIALEQSDVFANQTESIRIAAVGCRFGVNGYGDLGGLWLNGPSNTFVDRTFGTRIGWNWNRYNGLGYWRENDSATLASIPYEIDALAFLPNGDFILSLKDPGEVAGLTGGPDGEWVDDSDLILYRPLGLGVSSHGSMHFYFDGSDVGLSGNNEDIDALAIDDSGRLIMSTQGLANVPGAGSFNNRTLVRFTPFALGSNTTGSWEQLIDGSDIGLNSTGENIDGLDLVPAEGDAVLSVLVSVSGNLNVPGLPDASSGPVIFRFDATQLGAGSGGDTEGAWSIYASDSEYESYPSYGEAGCFALFD
jgi:hypothetical protein